MGWRGRMGWGILIGGLISAAVMAAICPLAEEYIGGDLLSICRSLGI